MLQKVLKMTVLFGKFLEKCWKNRDADLEKPMFLSLIG